MTIDEEIKHQEEISDRYARMSEYEENNGNDGIAKDCAECAADHRQLAEWLTELKELKNSIGAVKLSNMKEALALIRTLKAELNGWKEDPFGIIAEVCGAVTDCSRCQWYEKCPFPKNYGNYPEEWRKDEHS
jgi:bacterioferritin-associated ferredoxin